MLFYGIDNNLNLYLFIAILAEFIQRLLLSFCFLSSFPLPVPLSLPERYLPGVIGGLLWVVIYHRGKLEGMTTKGILIMIVLSLYFGFTSIGVDNWCHVGGMLCGFLATLILYHGKRQKY